MSDQLVYVYAGTAKSENITIDPDEVEEAAWFDQESVLRMLKTGMIPCGISQLGLANLVHEKMIEKQKAAGVCGSFHLDWKPRKPFIFSRRSRRSAIRMPEERKIAY